MITLTPEAGKSVAEWCLRRALDWSNNEKQRYHIRQALQHGIVERELRTSYKKAKEAGDS